MDSKKGSRKAYAEKRRGGRRRAYKRMSERNA
jgi:hypothetical protein